VPINENQYSIRGQIPHHIKMSALLLRFAGDATVREQPDSNSKDEIKALMTEHTSTFRLQFSVHFSSCSSWHGA
jgi:hypothetical protein